MKKIILGLALIIATGLTATAQTIDSAAQQQHPFMHRHHQKNRMATRLQFSEQQQAQLKTINSAYHNKLANLKKNEDITVRELKAGMAALHREHRSQLQALLTPEQKSQVARMKQEHAQTAKINAMARAEKMKVKLGLSDAQAAQLKDIRTNLAIKMKSIHADSTLSQEQKHQQMKTLVLEQKGKLSTILTPDQLQELQQLRAQHRRRDFSK